jgi:dipeptidase E
MRLLLLSNSTNFGAGYLEHATEPIAAHFGGIRRIVFVPFALHDQTAYHAKAQARFQEIGIEVDRLPEGPGAAVLLENAEGIFVGGGNTFRLLDRLQRSGVVELLRARVLGGMPYLGASAGTVIAAPTIRTTNDMPIVEPQTLAALGLVSFQINCHYLDPDPASRHMGETRETRLLEFLEENDVGVVGLREGAMLEVGAKGAATLRGRAGARLFRRGSEPVEVAPGARLDDWVRGSGA